MSDRRSPDRDTVTIACSLSDPEQQARRRELDAIFGSAVDVREMPDGREFTFPGKARVVTELAEIVAFERECCPFLTFELHFEPRQGPARLRVLGPPEAREFIRGAFGTTRPV
jgi:hypothetical protein